MVDTLLFSDCSMSVAGGSIQLIICKGRACRTVADAKFSAKRRHCWILWIFHFWDTTSFLLFIWTNFGKKEIDEDRHAEVKNAKFERGKSWNKIPTSANMMTILFFRSAAMASLKGLLSIFWKAFLTQNVSYFHGLVCRCIGGSVGRMLKVGACSCCVKWTCLQIYSLRPTW